MNTPCVFSNLGPVTCNVSATCEPTERGEGGCPSGQWHERARSANRPVN